MPHPKIIAIIPARGGSKRLPNKNLKILDGRPLLWHVIKAIKNSKVVNRLIVSSDSNRILKIAKRYGATPSKRPKSLATDQASSIAVIKYEIRKHHLEGARYVMLCQPTSPLLKAKTIRKAIGKMIKNQYDCLFSLTRVQIHPRYYRAIKSNGVLSEFLGIGKNLKDRPLYQHNGAIYIYKTKFLLKTKANFPFSKKNSGFILMPPAESVDVDTKDDLELASLIIKGQRTHKHAKKH